jgi:hypothetical protein
MPFDFTVLGQIFTFHIASALELSAASDFHFSTTAHVYNLKMRHEVGEA